MATKISGAPPAGPLDGTELIELSQNVGGLLTTVRSTAAAVIGLSPLAAAFGTNPATTTGLTYGYNGGNVYSNGANIAIAAGTVALVANQTNYVQRTAAGVVSANTTGFTVGLIPMAQIVAGGGSITSISDKRPASLDLRARQAVAVAATNITLTDAQANARILSFQGALTANVVVTFPAYQQQWVVSNETTGAFSLQVKTAAGIALPVPQGTAQVLYGDGTNVKQASAGPSRGFKNYLINGDFQINQRAFAGGALAAGVYGFDRWKAGTGGCNVSLSAGVLTHTSGPLVQVIEAPNLAGETITVSVDALSGGNLSVNVEGVTGVIVASAGRSGASIAVPGTSTGNVTVTLTPASGAVTYKRVQVELGSVATSFEWRPPSIEQSLCNRYFIRLLNLDGNAYYIFGAGYSANTTQANIPVTLISLMRATPAMTYAGGLALVQAGVFYTSISGITLSYGVGLATLTVTLSTASLTTNVPTILAASNDATAKISLDAEL